MKTRVLYIGGLGRSGTTLIERVLGELPGMCALGEVVHLWQRDLRDNERCGCGSSFHDCSFWTAVGDLAFGGWARVDVHRILQLQELVERTRHIPMLAAGHKRDFNALAVEYAEYYAAIYQAAATVSGAAAIIDSSKHSALAWCLRYSEEIDLRVLHVVRDPRGVAYSWTKTVARPETDGRSEMTRYTPARSAVLWNAHNAAFGLLRQRGVAVRRLRYEDFLADPRGTVDKVAAFAGLDTSTAELSFLGPGSVQLGQCHSAAGNPMRFTVGEVPLRPDDAWRTALPPRQRAIVGAVCAPLLRTYGYPLSSSAPFPRTPVSATSRPSRPTFASSLSPTSLSHDPVSSGPPSLSAEPLSAHAGSPATDGSSAEPTGAITSPPFAAPGGEGASASEGGSFEAVTVPVPRLVPASRASSPSDEMLSGDDDYGFDDGELVPLLDDPQPLGRDQKAVGSRRDGSGSPEKETEPEEEWLSVWGLEEEVAR